MLTISQESIPPSCLRLRIPPFSQTCYVGKLATAGTSFSLVAPSLSPQLASPTTSEL